MAESSFNEVAAESELNKTEEVPNVSTISALNTPNLTSEDPLNLAANESEISMDTSAIPLITEVEEEAALDSANVEEDSQPPEEKPVSRDVSEQKIRFLEDRILAAETERDKANVMMANTANRNAAYKRELENYKLEASERIAFIRNLQGETVRLSKECEFLKQKNDLAGKENEKWKIDGERLATNVQFLNEQLNASKAINSELRDKHFTAQSDINSLKDKLQAVEFECEKYRAEVRILSGSKRFYSEMESQAEDEKDDLRMKVFRLESDIAVALGSLELGRQQLAIEQRRCEQSIFDKNGELQTLQNQLQELSNENQSLLLNLEQVKSSNSQLESKLNETVNEVTTERNQVALIRQQYKQKLAEFHQQIATLSSELETFRVNATNELANKDGQIVELKSETEKLNEKLQLYAKMSNAGDPELMAPAAARTAQMMKGANSLTEIYAEHFSLIAELETKKADLREAARTMILLRETLAENMPAMRQRQEQFDQATREAEILQEQVDRHKKDRDELVSERNSYLNELRFTKDSLEKYQRECQTLSKQVQHLTAQTTGQFQMVDESSELFSNIQELQQKNLELISRIQTMEIEKDEAIRNAQDAQFNELKHQLEIANQNADAVELRSKHLSTCKNEAEKQRDYYKKMFDDLQKRSDDSMDAIRVNELKRNLDVSQKRAQLAEQRLIELKQELLRKEQQMSAKDEIRTKASEEAKSLLKVLNESVETKQLEINNLLDEKKKIEHALCELEKRHKVQSNHISFLEKNNKKLMDKNISIAEELCSLQGTKFELEKQLSQWKNSTKLAHFEIDNIKQRVNSNVNLTSIVSELTSVLDRKRLLIESLNDGVINKLTAERDEFKGKVDQLISEKSTLENELRAEVLKFQNECTRLEVEWEAARKLVSPLESENNELRAQCRELSDDLINNQKLVSESKMSQTTVNVALNDAHILQKQLSEALETAEHWQTRYEQYILERASNESNAKDNSEQCNDPEHSILLNYISECKDRMNESLQRTMGLMGQIGTLEMKVRQYEDDLQIADSLTSSQSERLTQIEAEFKKLADDFTEINIELDRSKTENARLIDNLNEATSNYTSLEEESKNLKTSLQAEESNKITFYKLLEEKDAELSRQMEELRTCKATFESEYRRVESNLLAAQQRETQLNERLIEARQEIEQLASGISNDALLESMKRAVTQMREERTNETSLRFQMTAETNELRSKIIDEQNISNSLRSDLNSAHQEIQIKNDLLDEQKDKIELYNSLQAKIDALTEERNTLQKNLADLEAERKRMIEHIEGQVSDKDSQVQTLNQQIDSLETNLKESIERENKLKTDSIEREEKLKKNLADNNENLNKLRALARNYKVAAEEAKKLAGPNENLIASMKRQNEEQNAQQIQKLNAELTSKNKELEETRIKLSSTQEALSNAAAQSANIATSSKSSVTSRLMGPSIRAALGKNLQIPPGRANVNKELQNKARQVLELSTKNQVLEAKITELEGEVAKLNEQIIELMTESGKKEAELMEKSEELKKSAEEVSSLEMRNMMIQSTLENTRKKFEAAQKQLDGLNQSAA